MQLKVASWNCRTIRAKWRRSLLAKLASDLSTDIVMLQELSITAPDGLQTQELGEGWQLNYTTADKRGNGGVGVLISPRLRNCTCVTSVTNRIIQVDVRLKRSRCVRLLGIYSPTAAKPEAAQSFLETLSSHLESLPQRDTVTILGDFNAEARQSTRAPFTSTTENANTSSFEDFLRRHDLVSVNCQFRKPARRLITFTGHKRRKRGQTGKMATTRLAQLDHILIRAREKRRARNCDTTQPMAIASDHRLLHCTLNMRHPLYCPPQRPRRRYTGALRNENVKNQFSSTFAKLIGEQPAADYSVISAAIRETATRTLPLAKKAPGIKPIWMEDDEVQKAQQKVIQLRSQGRDCKQAERELALTFKERQVAAIDEALEEMITAGPDKRARIVWPVINRLTGRRQQRSLNLRADSPAERKQQIKTFFAATVNASPPPPMDEMPLPPGTQLPTCESFNTSGITLAEVLQSAKKTPGGKACGPDEVPVEALRVPRVAMELVRVMNNIMDGGQAPVEWREAHIVGIPKKAGTSKVEDLRGISLMSTAAKLFNKILLSRLQPILDPFLRHEQNGFRPQRGTVTQRSWL